MLNQSVKFVKVGGALAAAWLLSMGCTPEPYAPCTLPSNDVIKEACSGSEGSEEGGVETTSAASCVVDFVFECESQLCGVFQGSDPYCTERCEGPEDTSCPNGGTCQEFVPTTGEFYCIPPE